LGLVSQDLLLIAHQFKLANLHSHLSFLQMLFSKVTSTHNFKSDGMEPSSHLDFSKNIPI